MKHLFVFGTRPEAIKMAPLIQVFKAHALFECKICVTGQHREMLDQVLDFFEIQPDYDLDLMKPDQTLFDITARALQSLKKVIDDCEPDVIFVQGDTTSAFVGALAGYYKQIKVAHIEAGLRSGNLHSPFPEEGNRLLVSRLTKFHFAPTFKAVQNLYGEGLVDDIHCVGNTVIDALFLGLQLINRRGDQEFYQHFHTVDFTKKIILVTAHRRESFGKPFEELCRAIRDLAVRFPEVEFIYPVHLNPNVRQVVSQILSGISNIHLIEPLSYPYLIWLMNKSTIVLTDSGGIQEEAPSLGKPVLVMREVTERTEGVEAGTAKLVSTNYGRITQQTSLLLTNKKAYEQMAAAANPYGDGTASQQICKFFVKQIKPELISE